MSDMAIVYTMIFICVAFLLMTFAFFVIGFLVGYKNEEKRIKEKQRDNRCEITESDKEKKAKKEWKKFLEYDGSAPEMRE